jgi:hypothetical protein
MKPLKNKNVILKIISLGDIETLISGNKHKPYAIGFYGPGINQIQFCNMNLDFHNESQDLVGLHFSIYF